MLILIKEETWVIVQSKLCTSRFTTYSQFTHVYQWTGIPLFSYVVQIYAFMFFPNKKAFWMRRKHLVHQTLFLNRWNYCVLDFCRIGSGRWSYVTILHNFIVPLMLQSMAQLHTLAFADKDRRSCKVESTYYMAKHDLARRKREAECDWFDERSLPWSFSCWR